MDNREKDVWKQKQLKRKLNLLSWNGRKAKYDIRDWVPGHEKMGKGVSLSAEEINELKSLLEKIEEWLLRRK